MFTLPKLLEYTEPGHASRRYPIQSWLIPSCCLGLILARWLWPDLPDFSTLEPGLRLIEWLKPWPAAFQTSLSQSFNEAIAYHPALNLAILTGNTDSLAPETIDNFRQTGLSHLVAVSGFNLTILCSLLNQIRAPVPPTWRRAWRWLLATCLTILFGASASVLRAEAMLSVALLAKQLGRPIDDWRLLLYSLTLLSLIDRQIPWQNVSFQLSFLATVGLISFSQSLLYWLQRWPSFIALGLTSTLAASCLTLPYGLVMFGRASPYFWLTNLLAVPLAEFVTVFSALYLAVAWLKLNYIQSWLGEALTAANLCLIKISQLTQDWPGG